MGSLFHPFASNTSILAGIGYSIFGMAVVFLMLWVLMLVIGVMARIARRNQEKEAAPETPASPALAPGSAGQIQLNDVPDETAAMLMAIVADELGKPLNEIRFVSIREVSE